MAYVVSTEISPTQSFSAPYGNEIFNMSVYPDPPIYISRFSNANYLVVANNIEIPILLGGSNLWVIVILPISVPNVTSSTFRTTYFPGIEIDSSGNHNIVQMNYGIPTNFGDPPLYTCIQVYTTNNPTTCTYSFNCILTPQ